MKYKLVGGILFFAIIAAGVSGVNQLINSGTRGIEEPEPVCTAECTSNTTTDRAEMLRGYLQRQEDGLNLSRQGLETYCPCDDTRILRYAVYSNRSQIGYLIYSEGEIELKITSG